MSTRPGCPPATTACPRTPSPITAWGGPTTSTGWSPRPRAATPAPISVRPAAPSLHRVTLYDRVGGQPWFDDLVERFYAGGESAPVLRPIYPDDLGPGKRHLALFLGQYWGGPEAYNELRGAPMLRAPHLPFPIGSDGA